MPRKIVKAWIVTIDRPPLQRGAINHALNCCQWMDDRISLSWRWFTPRCVGAWNQYGPPLEWLIETIRHVNRYLRESQYRS